LYRYIECLEILSAAYREQYQEEGKSGQELEGMLVAATNALQNFDDGDLLNVVRDLQDIDGDDDDDDLLGGGASVGLYKLNPVDT
jgi:hypothetical protein